jgi:hypothetical protein
MLIDFNVFNEGDEVTSIISPLPNPPPEGEGVKFGTGEMGILQSRYLLGPKR